MFQRNASLISCLLAGAMVMSCAPRTTKFTGVDGLQAAGVNASGTSFDIGAMANDVGSIPISTGGQANLGRPSGWILLSQVYSFIGAANLTNPPSTGSLVFSQYVDASKVAASTHCNSTDQYIPIYGFNGGSTTKAMQLPASIPVGTAFTLITLNPLNTVNPTCLTGLAEAAPGAPAIPNLTPPTITAISDVSVSTAGVAFQIDGSFPRLAISPNAELEVSMTCNWAASTGIKGSMTFSTGSGDITIPQGQSQSASALHVLLSPKTAPTSTSSSAVPPTYPNVCMIDVTVGYWQSASEETGLTLGNALASLVPHNNVGDGASTATAVLNVTGPNGVPLPSSNGIFTANVGEQLTYTWSTTGLSSITSYYYANANSYQPNASNTSCQSYTMADATNPGGPITVPWINVAGQYLGGVAPYFSGPTPGLTYGVIANYNDFANPSVGVVAGCQLGITYSVGITGLDETALPHKAELSIFVAAGTSQPPTLTSLTANAGQTAQSGASITEIGNNDPFTFDLVASNATQVQICSNLPNSACLTGPINSATGEGSVTTSVTNAGTSSLSVLYTATPFNSGIAGTPLTMTMKIDPATNSSVPASLTANSFGVCNGGSTMITAQPGTGEGSTTLCWSGSNLSSDTVKITGPGFGPAFPSVDVPAANLSQLAPAIPVGTSVFTLALDNCTSTTGVVCSESVTLTVTGAAATTPTLTSLSYTPTNPSGTATNANLPAGATNITLTTTSQGVSVQYSVSPANAGLLVKDDFGNVIYTETTSSGTFQLSAAQIAASSVILVTPTLAGSTGAVSYGLFFSVPTTGGNAAPPTISSFTASSPNSNVAGSAFVAQAGSNITFTFTANLATTGSFLISSPDGVTSIGGGGLRAGTFNDAGSTFPVVASSDGLWTLRVSNDTLTSAASCTASNCATATIRVDVQALVSSFSVSANGKTAQGNQTLTGVAPGQALTFSWTTNAAESVSMAFGTPTPTQGVSLSNTGPNASAQVTAPTTPGTYVYSLVPSGPSGLGVYQLIYVTVAPATAPTAPSITLTAQSDTTCTGNPMGGTIGNNGTLSIGYGQCFVVGWTVTGATSISGANGSLLAGSMSPFTGSYGFAATTNTAIPLRQALGANAAGSHSFTVNATGAGGNSSATITINVAAQVSSPVINSFTVTPSVQEGGVVSINANVTNATYVAFTGCGGLDAWGTQGGASGNWTASQATPFGVNITTNPTAMPVGNYTCTVTAQGAPGSGPAVTASAPLSISAATVAPTPPVITLTAQSDTTCTGNPMGGTIGNNGTLSIGYGQCFVVGWTVTGATSISGANGSLLAGAMSPFTGSYGFDASANSAPLRQALGAGAAGSHAFTVNATGAGGNSSATITINVAAQVLSPVINSFTVTPSVQEGGVVSINANVTNATYVAFTGCGGLDAWGTQGGASGNWTASQATPFGVNITTNPTAMPVGNYTCTVTAQGAPGSGPAVTASAPLSISAATVAPTPPVITLTAQSDTTCTGNPMGGTIGNNGTLSIGYGQCFVVGWTVTGATSISGANGSLLAGAMSPFTGSYGFDASANSAPLRQALGAGAAGSHAFTVNATGAGGNSSATLTINVGAQVLSPVINSFTVTPSVQEGGVVSINANVTNATYVAFTGCGGLDAWGTQGGASGNWTASQATPFGVNITTNPTAMPVGNYTCTVTAQGAPGSGPAVTASAPLSISAATVAPTPPTVSNFSASYTSPTGSGSAGPGGTLNMPYNGALSFSGTIAGNVTSWSLSSGMGSITGSAAYSGSIAGWSSGETIADPSAFNTTFTLSASGPGGASNTQSISVVVGAAPPPSISNFQASGLPSYNNGPAYDASAGGSITFTWTMSNYTSSTQVSVAAIPGYTGAPVAPSGCNNMAASANMSCTVSFSQGTAWNAYYQVTATGATPTGGIQVVSTGN